MSAMYHRRGDRYRGPVVAYRLVNVVLQKQVEKNVRGASSEKIKNGVAAPPASIWDASLAGMKQGSLNLAPRPKPVRADVIDNVPDSSRHADE